MTRLDAWREARRFRALPRPQRALVFYAEDAASWVHLEEIARALLEDHGREICYLTSDAGDPLRRAAPPGLRVFHVGRGLVRTSLFLSLDAGVLVLTLPELEAAHLKRSREHPVHYAYVFHSLCSTHMIYRPGAFDHYDSVLCAGPHHVAEIRAREARLGLPAKRLVECGYGRLDALLRRRAQRGAAARAPGEPLQVLVAPSWGPEGLIERHGVETTRVLLAAGHRVTVRPHPVTRRRWPGALRALARRFAGEPRFALETDVAGQDSLLDADVLVSDWSGAALEYAFACERGVAFVDVPRKVNDPDYPALGLEPLEVSLRGEIGQVVAPGRLDAELPAAVARLCADPAAHAARIRAARARSVFHLGESGAVAARALDRLLSFPEAMAR